MKNNPRSISIASKLISSQTNNPLILKKGQRIMVGPYENGEYRKAIAVAQSDSIGITIKFEDGRIETRESKDIHLPEELISKGLLKESVLERYEKRSIPTAVRIPLNFFPGELK